MLGGFLIFPELSNFGSLPAEPGVYPLLIIALGIAIKSLKGAKVYRKDGQVVVLNNPIKVSAHSFVDIVDALTGVTPQHGMKMIAVLLEQIVYRQNPDCEYQ